MSLVLNEVTNDCSLFPLEGNSNSKDNLNLLVSSIEKFVGAHMENFLNVKVMQSETLQFEKIGTVTLYNCLI